MKLRYSLMLGALLILAGTSCEDKLDIPQKGVLDFSTYSSNPQLRAYMIQKRK